MKSEALDRLRVWLVHTMAWFLVYVAFDLIRLFDPKERWTFPPHGMWWLRLALVLILSCFVKLLMDSGLRRLK